MQLKFWTFLVVLLLIGACTSDRMPELIALELELKDLVDRSATLNGVESYILPASTDLERIPQDVENNPLTEAKVELGKFLFYETGFATNARRPEGMGTYSCATCHIPEAGFKAGFRQGIADGGIGFGVNGESRRRSPAYITNELDVQSARPLSLVNVAFVKNTLWNGRFGAEGTNVGTENLWKESDGTALNELGFEAIETQNFEGIETHRIHITKELIDAYGYTELFDASFPGMEDDLKYSNHAGSLALSAYIRSLMSDRAPFQEWLKGDSDAMTPDEKRGAILFFGKANCSNCHHQENLGSGEFHALGVKDIDDAPYFRTTEAELQDRNMGRGAFTGVEEDMFRFKVPGLYNAGDSEHFFHGSSALTLEDVITYKNEAVTENIDIAQEQLSSKFVKLNLTEEEQAQLVTFIRSGLRDPELTRYKPESIRSDQCFPNNDSDSQIDLGCQ
jgi:cytochrome c peroxidase